MSEWDHVHEVDDNEEEEYGQPVRIVYSDQDPRSLPQPTKDDTVFIEIHMDDDDKEIVLWGDILAPFDNVLHLRQGTRILPFIKDLDFRPLDPPRVYAIPNTVLDVVVERQLDEAEDDMTDDMTLLELQVAGTSWRAHNPELGLAEEVMTIYTELPVSITPVRAPQVFPDDDDGNTNNDNGDIADKATDANIDDGAIVSSINAQSSHNDNDNDNDNDNNLPSLPGQFDVMRQLTADTGVDNAYAQGRLAKFYRKYPSASQDDQAEMKQYIKAAEQGDASAQYCIGLHCLVSRDVSNSYQQAMDWFLKASKQGYRLANFELGNLHFYGRGIEKDYFKAMEWYLKAAEQGYIPSQSQVGSMYFFGLGVACNLRLAMVWYLKAAEHGDARSCNNIGYLYHNSLGVTKDYRQAMSWYLKASGQGNITAQHNIGLLYKCGFGVAQDYQQAMEWFLKAANQGLSIAQYDVGRLHKQGCGVPVDYAVALEWFFKAAVQGHVESQYEAGLLFEFFENAENDAKEIEE
ncbi:hypothetical protein BG015_010277 [Linnemannia schmuckeri]|uniref:HCP-like protein n=1 Tax=Linnemannia schmuckeri TaxID=64567 RepID=A0A9P5RUS7_9FUNG|nr:hypothetical protein BG015_010277 [Linnemannia schmuckeri]